jgi:hypothetical protein
LGVLLIFPPFQVSVVGQPLPRMLLLR